MTKVNIFLTGATGYIGGSVLERLLTHPRAISFRIKALVRSPDKARRLNSIGVETILGSLSDLAKIRKATSRSDVVFACADADNLEAAKAILSGLKQRHELTGQVPVLIHTSGTGVLCDEAWGMHSNATVYNDADSEQMASIPPTQVHRNVDLLLVEADRQGFVKTYIILPSMIYGVANGRLAQLGIQNSRSIHIPVLIKLGLHRRQGGMVGEGRNLWPNVEIGELADLYITLFNAILANRPTGHGRDGYYFGENGENSLYDVCKVIARALVECGRGMSPEPTMLSVEENVKYFQGYAVYLGSNARCRANRSRSIGWRPVKTTRDMLASIRPEVEALLRRLA